MLNPQQPQVPSQQVFMAYDGDNAGRMVGQAVLADDVNKLHEISNRIAHGHEIVKHWAEENGGQIVSGGGDEGTFQVPSEAIANIEQLRADYAFAVGLTITVGVGSTLSQAGKSLMAGKFRGKNQVVQYDPSVDEELAAAQEHVAAGTGTEEEKKIGEAYLGKEDAQVPTSEPHCQYCAEAEQDSHGDDCQYCNEHDAAQASGDNCQYCVEAEQSAAAAPAADHDHTDDCQYCAEAEADHEHTDDNCQYCAEAEATPPAHDHTGDDCQYCVESEAGAAPAGPTAPGAANPAANQLAAMVTTDDPNTQSEAGAVNALDPSEIAPASTTMVDGVARDDGFMDPQEGEMDLSEDENEANPDLTQVLQGGLDQQAQAISKEKVTNLIGQALQAVKSQKNVLEQAKQQAPQLYGSTIIMLKAMIEMGKMLGLVSNEQTTEDAPAQDQPGQAPATQGDAGQAPQ